MNRIYQLSAATVYTILFFLLLPLYQYVLDIDAISYIHVAERFAKGEYYYSINGYWSPLISWILVPFIKAGFDPVLSAKYINGLLGLLTLLNSCALIEKFHIHDALKRIIPFILAILFLSYSFYELCADLLQLFIFIIYLNVLFSKNFIRNNNKIFFAGILGAISYYAKAYNFPFFILHFAIVVFILVKKNYSGNIANLFLSKVAIGFVAFFLVTAPYVAVLTHKYGSVRINNAGKLNTSWFLERSISDSRKLVTAPPFSDATSAWDEPTYSQEKYYTPFTSVKHFSRQIKLFISNSIKLSELVNQISIFAMLILVGFLVYLFSKKQQAESAEWLLLLTTLLYPSGYLLIFVEWRYIWLLPITLLIMSSILLSYVLEKNYLSKNFFILIAFIFSASFMLQPINEMQDLANNNKDVYEIATIFKQKKIKGNFFLQYKSFEPYAKAVVLCYLTDSKIYGPRLLDYNFKELIDAAGKYNINYYLYFYDYPFEREAFLESPYAKAGIKIYDDLYPGLIVVQFR